MTLNESKSWEELVLRTNQNGTWMSKQGILFYRVIEPPEILFYPYRLFPVLATVSADGYDILQDANNNKILYSNDKTVMTQVFQGWNEPNLEVYMRYPAGHPQRKHPNSDIAMPAENLTSRYGYWLRGKDSPIFAPTGWGMFYLPYNFDVDVGIYNPELFEVNPVVLYIMCKLKFHALDPRKDDELPLIIRMLNQSWPGAFWSPGKFLPDYPEFEANFGVPPICWNGVRATVDGQTIYEARRR